MAPWLWSVAWAGKLVLGSGTVVVVTDVGGTDPSATDRGALLGEVCAVGSPALESSGDGWWRGELRCASGVTYNVTTVAVAVPGTATLPTALSASALAGNLGKTVHFPVPVTAPGAKPGPAPERPAAVIVASPNVAPAEALTRGAGAGEAVRIVALSPDDAFYTMAGAIVGRTCYATEPLAYRGDGWQSGPMSCWDGDDFVFYKVALALDPTHANLDVPARPKLLPDRLPERAEAPASAPAGPPEGTLGDGARVRIDDVGTDDGNFGDKGSLVGRRCTVKGELRPQPGDWWTGGLACGQRYLFFYKVRVAEL